MTWGVFAINADFGGSLEICEGATQEPLLTALPTAALQFEN